MIYFKRQNQDKEIRDVDVLHLIVKQLLLQSDDSSTDDLQVVAGYSPKAEFDLIQELLKSLPRKFGKVFYILDGVDECVGPLRHNFFLVP